MPRTFKEFLPEKDYAGRLALGLGLLILGQVMTLYEGVLYIGAALGLLHCRACQLRHDPFPLPAPEAGQDPRQGRSGIKIA